MDIEELKRAALRVSNSKAVSDWLVWVHDFQKLATAENILELIDQISTQSARIAELEKEVKTHKRQLTGVLTSIKTFASSHWSERELKEFSEIIESI